MATPNHPRLLPANVQAALDRGEFVTAIKLLRESSGLGLAEAKQAIDRMRKRADAGAPAAPRKARAEAAPGAEPGTAPHEPQHAFGPLAPGEVPRSRTRVWLVVVVAAALYLLWRFVRSAPQ